MKEVLEEVPPPSVDRILRDVFWTNPAAKRS